MLDHGATRALLDDLGGRVAAAWGEPSRCDLELRTGLIPDLVAARARVGEAAWSEVVQRFLAGPRPRAVATGLLVLLRRCAPAPRREREVTTTAYLPSAPAPAPGLSRYQRAVLALLGPCLPPGKVQ